MQITNHKPRRDALGINFNFLNLKILKFQNLYCFGSWFLVFGTFLIFDFVNWYFTYIQHVTYNQEKQAK